MKPTFRDDSDRVVAAVAATAIMLLMVWLMLRPIVVSTPVEQEGLRVRFIVRVPTSHVSPPPAALPASRRQPHAAASPLASRQQPGGVPSPTVPRADPLHNVANGRVPLQLRIEIKEAEIAVSPPGMINERELQRARNLLYPPNPMEAEETVIDNPREKFAKAISGKGTSRVTARPPPDVPFKPHLFEQPTDLGSERTGDAYKAAPIAFQKAPGLKGEASRGIREQLQALLQRHAGCDPQRVERLAVIVRGHLTELEQTEHASSHGADPVMASHGLRGRADSAYDQARRALWYANEQLASCAK